MAIEFDILSATRQADGRTLVTGRYIDVERSTMLVAHTVKGGDAVSVPTTTVLAREKVGSYTVALAEDRPSSDALATQVETDHPKTTIEKEPAPTPTLGGNQKESATP